MSANKSTFTLLSLLIIVFPIGIPGKKKPSLPEVNIVYSLSEINPSGK